MTLAQELASFITRASFEDLSEAARFQLKVRVLDSLGCAIGALQGEPIALLKALISDLGGNNDCTLIGGGSTSPDRAALYNGALVRYLDFNDSYLARGETCHPSDNLSALLAASEYAGKDGRELLTALAVAYQVQCRLSEVAPVRAKGFDHTTQGSYAVAAGVSKALGLDEVRTSHALALSGTAFNALRVTRTGSLSHWKGLAYPNTAFACTHATFMAKHGITGPLAVFEGNKGFMDAIAGPFQVDWPKEDLERVTQTSIKKHNAEIHAQSAIEAVLELKAEHGFAPEEIQQVEVEIFDVAYHIIGGGEEGDKTIVETKEAADHSLHYLIAVALLDAEVTPRQYTPRRIHSGDTQALLQRVSIHPNTAYSQCFPSEMPCLLRLFLQDGRVLEREKRDYEGFPTNPIQWGTAVKKFEELTASHMAADLRHDLVEAIDDLESITVKELSSLLAKVGQSTRT